MQQNISKHHYLVLCLVLLFASFFRLFIGLHWDHGLLLHPDERFLTMVAEKVRLPNALIQYLNGNTNPLSPYNNGYDYYVYGNLPLTIVRIFAEIFKTTSYDNIFIVGRIFSGIADLSTIVGVFFLGSMIATPSVGLLAAFLLAGSVQNIQLCRFMGTENFVGCFITWSAVALCCAYRQYQKLNFFKARIYIITSGALIGLALASKISAVFFLPIALSSIGIALFFPSGDYITQKRLRATWFEFFVGISLIFGFSILLFFRLAQPSAFDGMSFMPSPTFLDNMKRIKELTDGGEWPPNVQWAARTPILFPLSQMMQWEMGYGFFWLTVIGTVVAVSHIVANKNFRLLFIVSWAVFFLSYQSTRFVAFGRYLSIVYPFFAILGAYGAWYLYKKSNFLPRIFVIGCLIISVFWTIAFNTIYFKDHSRVEASRWIYQNVPAGSVLLNEAWDDGLPLRVDGKDGFASLYKEVSYNFYEVDNDKKRNEILDALDKVNYIMISSNRQFASIPRLPKRFPFTSQYYEMLFSHKIGFTLVHQSIVAPSFLGITIQDKNAVESFTVYDHPAVYIFKKNDSYSREAIETVLNDYPNGTFEPLIKIDAEEISWLP